MVVRFWNLHAAPVSRTLIELKSGQHTKYTPIRRFLAEKTSFAKLHRSVNYTIQFFIRICTVIPFSDNPLFVCRHRLDRKASQEGALGWVFPRNQDQGVPFSYFGHDRFQVFYHDIGLLSFFSQHVAIDIPLWVTCASRYVGEIVALD